MIRCFFASVLSSVNLLRFREEEVDHSSRPFSDKSIPLLKCHTFSICLWYKYSEPLNTADGSGLYPWTSVEFTLFFNLPVPDWSWFATSGWPWLRSFLFLFVCVFYQEAEWAIWKECPTAMPLFREITELEWRMRRTVGFRWRMEFSESCTWDLSYVKRWYHNINLDIVSSSVCPLFSKTLPVLRSRGDRPKDVTSGWNEFKAFS